MFFFTFNCKSQQYYKIKIIDSSYVPILQEKKNDGSLVFDFPKDKEFENELNKLQLKEFFQAYPTSKYKELLQSYIVKIEDSTGLDFFVKKYSNIFSVFYQLKEDIQLTFTPNDFYINPNGVTNKHLDLIRAKEAWEITKGDPSIILGISDTYLKTTLEDISQKISYPVLGNNNDNNSSWSYHGSATSGCMVAQTDNNLGICGIGFNCKLKFNSNWGNNNEILLMSQQGIPVVNLSWASTFYDSDDNLLYKEIRENGTLVISTAGNSATSGLGSLTTYVYPACYDSVMCITSVGYKNDYGTPPPNYGNWKDLHNNIPNDPNSAHHHHDKVDLCAPGYDVPCLFYDINNPSVNNLYHEENGTSFASPMVAGVAGLVLSVNPCLKPFEIEYILKSTAANIYSIPENVQYTGQLGAGRVDAYEAVKKTYKEASLFFKNQTLSGNSNYEAIHSIFAGEAPTIFLGLSGNTNIASGSNIVFSAGKEIYLGGGFEVALGGVFLANNIPIVCP